MERYNKKHLKTISARMKMRKSRAIRHAMSELALPSGSDTPHRIEDVTEDNIHEESSVTSPSMWQSHDPGGITDEDRESYTSEMEIENILEIDHNGKGDNSTPIGKELNGPELEIEDDVDQMTDVNYYSAEDNEPAENESEDENIEVNADDNACGLFCLANVAQMNEIVELKKWAVECSIRHSHIDKLLQILRPRLLPDLPKSAKTFLHISDALYHIEKIPDSRGDDTCELVYFGLANGLKKCVNPELHRENDIQLQIHIDGLPLYRSSSKQFWPILCKIDFDPDIYKPFPVAIYCGEEKPKSVDVYLEKLVEEVNLLQENGIDIDGIIFGIRIKCFIADTPARTFIKCVKGHGGYAACERCTVNGVRCNRRMIYNSAECPERTDAAFRAAEQREHHNGVSPLTRIRPQINMITHFVLDFMHLCCLGVMKKLISYWLDGNLNFRLCRASKMRLSERMKHLRTQTPYEFERKPRSIFEVANWKATEYRFFLLYCGPVVLKNILSTKLYRHFLLLHVSCRILCSKTLCLKRNYIDPTKIYLRNFFLLMREHYGPDSHVMNVHNLIHIVSDVENMRAAVNSFTAFPFENLLGQMKRMLRTGNRPLAQVCRRVHEAFFVTSAKVTIPPDVMILKKGSGDPSDDVPVQKLRYRGATLTTTAPNNYVLLHTNEIIEIDNMVINREVITISGRQWKIKKSLFMYPCDSKLLKMWQLQRQPSSTKITCELQSVDSKMLILNIEDKWTYTMPLLHM